MSVLPRGPWTPQSRIARTFMTMVAISHLSRLAQSAMRVQR
jgi:hypothetical protein